MKKPQKTRLALYLDKEEIKKLKIRALKAGKSVSRYFVMVSDYFEKKKK